MGKFTDQEIANYLLEMRQHNDRRPWKSYLKKHQVRWFTLIVIAVVLFTAGVFWQNWWLCGFVVGWIVGVTSQLRAQIQQAVSIWPIYEKFIDWLKVEKIPKGEPSA